MNRSANERCKWETLNLCGENVKIHVNINITTLILKSSVSPQWAPKMHSQLDHFSHIHLVNSCGAERRESHSSQFYFDAAAPSAGCRGALRGNHSHFILWATSFWACLAEHLANQLSPSRAVTSLVCTSFPGMKARGPNGTCSQRGGQNRRGDVYTEQETEWRRRKFVEVVDEPDFLSASVC